jgi:hypothetical protein
VAWNKCLKESVQAMDWIILLRNAHPTYRDTFARKLLEVKAITRAEAGEFMRII